MAAIKNHTQKALPSIDPMSNPPGDIRHLAWVQLHDSPLGIVHRMSAKLEPDLVLIATSVKPPLLPFQIVAVDSKLLAGVEDRRLGSAFSRHPSKVIKGPEFLEPAPAFLMAADQL